MSIVIMNVTCSIETVPPKGRCTITSQRAIEDLEMSVLSSEEEVNPIPSSSVSNLCHMCLKRIVILCSPHCS